MIKGREIQWKGEVNDAGAKNCVQDIQQHVRSYGKGSSRLLLVQSRSEPRKD